MTRWLRRIVGIGALASGVLVALAIFVPALHLTGSRPVRMFGATGARPHVAAVYVSGDMGLRFGMGPKVAAALAARGIPVVGIDSAVAFASRRTRGEVDAIVTDAIRMALARTGAPRVVLMGQSFGADMVATAAPDLPRALRDKVAAIGLVVPARTVFFRADPTSLTYRGTPDAIPAPALRTVRWAPIVCIWGVEETDSLCPRLGGTAARVIGLPGGHFLHRDETLLVATVVRALRAADPTIVGDGAPDA